MIPIPTFRGRLTCALLAGMVLAACGLRGAEPTGAAQFIYTLSPQDKLRIDVYQELDLANSTRVDALGNINLSLIGEVHVGGLTVPQAQTAIENAYHDGRYLAHPQVTISIEEYAAREVSIQGQVKNPGRFLLPVESTFSVVDLVTKAGGFTDIAQGGSVTITHTAPDGKKTVLKVDVDAIIKGKKSAQGDSTNLLLQPGDVVYVPERLI